tara:strand:+ start:313 stop:606 length:294 start_codon:yes stop_codon:yes gene_type:complete
MTNQEFKENMLLLIKQIELLTCELHMKAELSPVKGMAWPGCVESVCEVELNCMGYKTVDRFNSSMSFEESDIKKIAASLASSFFADYFQSLSLRINK